MPNDMEWSDEVDSRLDDLETGVRKTQRTTMFLSGASVFLGIGVACTGIGMIRLVKGFNQIVPVVNGLSDLANAAAQQAAAYAPVPMPKATAAPQKFDDKTPAAPVAEGWDPGERDPVDVDLSTAEWLREMEDAVKDGGEELPSTEGLPDPRQ